MTQDHESARRSAKVGRAVSAPKEPKRFSEIGYHRIYSRERYLEMIVPVLESSSTLTEAAKKLGISWRTLQRWLSSPEEPEETKRIKAERFPHGGNRLG